MNIFDMCRESTFPITIEIALITMKFDGFGVDFIDMDVKLGTCYGFEGTTVTKMFTRVFVYPLDVELQTLLPSETSTA